MNGSGCSPTNIRIFATAFSLVAVINALELAEVNITSPLSPLATFKVSGAIVPLSTVNPTV